MATLHIKDGLRNLYNEEEGLGVDNAEAFDLLTLAGEAVRTLVINPVGGSNVGVRITLSFSGAPAATPAIGTTSSADPHNFQFPMLHGFRYEVPEGADGITDIAVIATANTTMIIQCLG